MPDLLAHAFLAYSLGRLLAWRYDWLTRPYVTLVMVGAFVPDLVKIELVAPDGPISRALGVPFDWGSLTTGGGVLVSTLVGVVLLSSAERRRGGGLLALGAGSHLLTDALLLTPSGRTIQPFWPLVQYAVPSPGLYLSTEPGPTILTGLLAGTLWAIDRYRSADAA